MVWLTVSFSEWRENAETKKNGETKKNAATKRNQLEPKEVDQSPAPVKTYSFRGISAVSAISHDTQTSEKCLEETARKQESTTL